ncbi:MAG: hypothetical protein JXB30_18495 [Anaerolineae bacterium]|nr:hypothetical protein [Anaerolineae bacterium]
MNIIDLLQHTARLMWGKKHLMVLGTLFVIVTSGLRFQDILAGPLVKPLFALYDIPTDLLPLADYRWLADLLIWVEAHGLAGWLSLVIGVMLLGIVVGITAIVVRGALIASAGAADTITGLGAALKVSWRKTWRLIIIASIPPIPVTIAAILIVILTTVVITQAGGIDALAGSEELHLQLGGGLAIASVIILLPFSIVTFLLGLLSTMADRACVLGDRKVVESYRRGWEVLRANAPSAALLALLHLVAGSLIGSLLFLPGMLSMLCFAVVPLLWIVEGIEKSFFITMWTLAWREWTGNEPDGFIEQTPAV